MGHASHVMAHVRAVQGVLILIVLAVMLVIFCIGMGNVWRHVKLHSRKIPTQSEVICVYILVWILNICFGMDHVLHNVKMS